VKLALIGNMNNNNFAMLRYFRDLGVDAHLLLMSNDGKGHSSHFTPEADSHEIEKWRPFIHQTNISEDLVAAFNFPISWLLYIRSYLRSIFNSDIVGCQPISKKYITNELSGYSHYIGSGIMPAVFNRVGIKLDIFFPYAIGVEYVGESIFLSKFKNLSRLSQLVLRVLLKRQINGIKESRHVVNIERSFTENTLRDIGVKSIPMFVPMLYRDNGDDDFDNQLHFKEVLKKVEKSNFSIISHARLMWFKPSDCSDVEWKEQSRNNDRLVRAFSRLVLERKDLRSVLVLFEYGPDVAKTKELIYLLGISEYVHWLPKSYRKDILRLIPKFDVGIGEFYDIPGVLWGGTALEVLACGKPLIQGLAYTSEEFYVEFNSPKPPILHAQTEGDIYKLLVKLADSPLERRLIGENSKSWFDEYAGYGLAKKWLTLLGV